ncbi:hypothetical protein C8A03DRAFT_30191 [Achaetomium macrosporum]|uniref:Nucleoside phosphorylase domain-containing protein n=1 Tax=Achaetomium macrosporum TaxID=79813 RepID=A0AAN7HGY9_9PEZI|nr:hypothetical protein C8A03DRAFT_30191 [Achaetomium macrosporum]
MADFEGAATMPAPTTFRRPRRPATRRDFEIAVICALTIEADAVDALFDHRWDEDGPPYDKAPGDPNAYSTGAVGRHNIVLAHMPGMGKANTAAVAANCRASFPNIKLAVVVGICGVVPFGPGGDEILLGDVIVSDGVVQQAQCRDTRAAGKAKGPRSRKALGDKMAGYMDVLRAESELAAEYPGVAHDRLFEAAYRHVGDGMSCEECGCNGSLVPRSRLGQDSIQPVVHFGLIASGDAVMKSGEDRDAIARQEGIVAFEVEGLGVLAYASIAQECQVPGYDDPKADVLLLVKGWLERKYRGPWLMVIDNADDIQLFFGGPANSSCGNASSASSYVGKLELYIPEPAHGSPLITTRNKQVGLRLAKGNIPIELEKMDDVESEKLLRTRLKDEYLRLLNTSDQALVDLLSEEFETVGRDSGTPRAVAETWILSFEQIQRQNTKKQGQEQRGEIQLTKALGVLKPFCFVVEDKGHRFDMHHLVQIVTQKWLGRRGTISQFAEQALLVVSQAYPFGNYENRAICSAYLSHVYAVLKFDGTGSEGERVAKASLLHGAGGLFYYQGQWKDAEKFLEQAAGWRRAVLGLEHPDTLTSMANLASTYLNQGRWKEAEALGVQVMETKKRVLGLEHPDTLTSMANLAWTYRNQGRWKEAEALFVQVMATSARVLGEEHPNTLASMHNLALTYRDQGRWKEAESLFVQVMATSARVLGEEHPNTLTSMHNLALTYWEQSRWKEAEALQVQVMETRKRVLGSEHPDTLTSVGNLASTYRDQGRWKEAEALDVQLMETTKRVLGEEHPTTLTSMANLASTYRNQGRWKESEALFVQVMETRKRVLGEEHPDTLTSMANLAHTWKSQDRIEDAIDLMKTCFCHQQQVLGRHHPDTVSTLSVLTKWQEDSGNTDA